MVQQSSQTNSGVLGTSNSHSSIGSRRLGGLTRRSDTNSSSTLGSVVEESTNRFTAPGLSDVIGGPRAPEVPDVMGGPTEFFVGPRDTRVPEAPEDTKASELSKQYQSIRETLVNNQEDPQLPESAKQTAVKITPGEKEFQEPTNIQEQVQVASRGFEAAEAQAAAATTPAEMAVAKAQVTSVASAVKGTVSRAATAGTSSSVEAQAAMQDLDAVDPKTMAKALTHNVPNEATVQGQLDGLLIGLETGEVPEWAKPAIAQAEAAMSSRGMSSSSVGRNAMFNSIITAAMPIAQADAKAKLSVFQQDISNEQQAMLANSQFFQTLTVKNLDSRQQAAIVNATNATNSSIANAQNQTTASIANAQSFLQMDVSNLNNEQQAKMAESQFRQQTMLTNTAAENAAKQFNAASQTQADQFNANLATSVSQFNTTQLNAASQFNSGAENAMAQFNANMNFQKDQFNAQNATAIEQSNIQWRRQMNQMNTASENAVNQANAMNQFNLSNQALTFLWQEARDGAKWANDNTQNDEERKTRIAIAALSNESRSDSTTAGHIKTLVGAAIDIYKNWE